jgi:hypothetical protein
MCTNKPLVLVDKDPWYRWALERLGLEYRYEGQGKKILQIPKEGENYSIPPQPKREKPHIGNKQPKPIHNILPGREGKRWVKMLIRTLPSRLWKAL